MPYIRRLAKAYHSLLTNLDWSDPLIAAGLREGRNKFLTNAYLNSILRGVHKYRCAHFVSLAALQQLDRCDYTGLHFEHVVPKQKYIQGPCEDKAASGDDLSIKFIEDLLRQYWCLATITESENDLLSATAMPEGWDEENIFARYEAAGNKLIQNPRFPEDLTSNRSH